MSSFLEQLGDNEAVLLMYLAGELAARDRAAVERRLAGDADLRAALDRLRALDSAVYAGLGRLDAVDPLPVDESAAVRGVAQVMRQRLAKPDRSAEPARAERNFRVPQWLVGTGAVAAAVTLAVTLLPRGTTGPRVRTPGGMNPDAEIAFITHESLREVAGESNLTARLAGETVVDVRATMDGAVARLPDAETPIFDVPLVDAGETAEP